MTRRLVNIMDMPDPEAALLPCPVCGKQPRESSSGLYHEFTCYHQYGDPDDDIGGVWVTARCDTREQAIAAWNRRHPPASREEGLRSERDDIIIAWLRQRGFIALADEAEKTFQPAALIPTKPEAKEGLRADLTKILNVDLNVTDEELLRIRNMCERDGDVKIWARMVQKLTDAVRRGRESLREQS